MQPNILFGFEWICMSHNFLASENEKFLKVLEKLAS